MANTLEHETALQYCCCLRSACLALGGQPRALYACGRLGSKRVIPRAKRRQIESLLVHSKPCFMESPFLFTCADTSSDLALRGSRRRTRVTKLEFDTARIRILLPLS
jgi:hypothetical protein